MRPGDVLEDIARFAGDDDEPVIWASFACSYCLRSPNLIKIGGAPAARRAKVHCGHCKGYMRVRLSEQQVFRLWTLPRGRVFVHFPPDEW